MGVVPGALLGIGEDLISGLDFGEAFGRGFDIVDVAIWMELEGFPSIRLFDTTSMLAEPKPEKGGALTRHHQLAVRHRGLRSSMFCAALCRRIDWRSQPWSSTVRLPWWRRSLCSGWMFSGERS